MLVSLHNIDNILTALPSSSPLDLSFDQLYTHSYLSTPLLSFRQRKLDLSKPPNSYREAISRPDSNVWLAAMKREYDSLEE
jgi:hypothetical protein